MPTTETMRGVPAVVPLAAVPGWEREADVVVVGQGIAGSCAALEAHRAGADVLIVERASGGGGAAASPTLGVHERADR